MSCLHCLYVHFALVILVFGQKQSLATADSDNKDTLEQLKELFTLIDMNTKHKKGDIIVGAQLTSSGLKFIEKDGNFVIPFHSSDIRVVVISETLNVENSTTSFRQIYSWLDDKYTKLTPEVMQYLLAENSRYKIGAWQLMKGENFVFQCEIPADATASYLHDVVHLAAGIVRATMLEFNERGWVIQPTGGESEDSSSR
jgi:hypothetical protein